jgi:DNA-binding MarR family transcriptional regulator
MPPDSRADDLRRVTQRFFRRFGALAADATPCGKPLSIAHAHALMVLLGAGELAQQELGAELCIDKSNVARLCAKMVEAGHARQRRCERDGRSRRVALPGRGERLAREVDAASRARFGALLDGIPAPRRDEVIAALRHLVAALDVPAERRAA